MNKSLLRREHTGRYFAHSVLKQYADDKFDDESARQEAYKLHAKYYTQFIEKLHPALDSDKEAAAYDAMDIELENLRAAWDRGVASKAWDVLDSTLMLLIRYYAARGLTYEGSESLAMLAEALCEDNNANNTFFWRARLGEMFLRSYRGEYDVVLEGSQQAYEYFTSQDMCLEASMALNNIAYVYTMQGNYGTARRVAEDALEIAQNSDYPLIRYKSQMAIAYLDYLTGDYSNAISIYEELLGHIKEGNVPVTLHADIKIRMGEVLRGKGEFEKATHFIQAAHDIYKSYSNKRGMAYTLNELGGIIFVQGDYDTALEYYNKAYQLYKDIGDRNGIAHAISAIGNTANVSNEYDRARQCYNESLDIRRDLGDRRGIADSLQDLARVALAIGNAEEAEKHIAQVIQIREEIGDRVGIGTALAGRAIGLLGLGRVDDALPDIERVLELSERLNDRFLYIQGIVAKGEYLYQEDKYEESLEYYLEALEMGSTNNVPIVTMMALSGIAGILLKFGETERALSLASIVQRYPRTFFPLAMIRAQEVVETAEQQLSHERISTITSESQMLVPEVVINDILTEFAAS